MGQDTTFISEILSGLANRHVLPSRGKDVPLIQHERLLALQSNAFGSVLDEIHARCECSLGYVLNDPCVHGLRIISGRPVATHC